MTLLYTDLQISAFGSQLIPSNSKPGVPPAKRDIHMVSFTYKDVIASSLKCVLDMSMNLHEFIHNILQHFAISLTETLLNLKINTHFTLLKTFLNILLTTIKGLYSL